MHHFQSVVDLKHSLASKDKVERSAEYLIAEAQSGCDKAMLSLLARFKPVLKKHANRVAKASVDPQDIYSEAIALFVDAVQAFDAGRSDNFGAYLNMRLNELANYGYNNAFHVTPKRNNRKRFWSEIHSETQSEETRRLRALLKSNPSAEMPDDLLVDSVDTLDRISYIEIKQKIVRALEVFPLRTQRWVREYYLSGRTVSFTEIAERDGVSDRYVRKVVKQAVAQLKGMLSSKH